MLWFFLGIQTSNLSSTLYGSCPCRVCSDFRVSSKCKTDKSYTCIYQNSIYWRQGY